MTLLHLSCPKNFTKEEFIILIAMLEYFSGDMLVRLYIEQDNVISDEIFSIAEEYIFLIAERYGTDNVVFV